MRQTFSWSPFPSWSWRGVCCVRQHYFCIVCVSVRVCMEMLDEVDRGLGPIPKLELAW